MRELRLIAVSEDGTRLLLRGDGQEPEFAVRIDERLHAALRGDRARLGQLEIQMDSQLRPRDIQARVRAGESVEQVAAVAGIPAERVMRYASPVLAEREHIADRAQRTAIRRQGGEGPAPLLGDTVEHRLHSDGVEDETIGWDAWRRDDGRWVVSTSWRAGAKMTAATWVFDPAGRSVSPADDAARALAGETPAPATPARQAPARLAVVPSVVEAPDVPEGVEEPAPTERQLPADEPWQESAAPAAAAAGGDAIDDTSPDRLRLSDIASHIEVSGEQTEVAGSARSRRARASVPTWDEIMFGRRRRTD